MEGSGYILSAVESLGVARTCTFPVIGGHCQRALGGGWRVGGATAAEPQFSGKRPIRSSWVVLGINKCTGQELKVECTVATQADVPTRPFIDIKPDEARERKAIELFDFAQVRGKNDLQGALLGETVHCENCTRVARVRKVSLTTTHLQPPRPCPAGSLTAHKTTQPVRLRPHKRPNACFQLCNNTLRKPMSRTRSTMAMRGRQI